LLLPLLLLLPCRTAQIVSSSKRHFREIERKMSGNLSTFFSRIRVTYIIRNQDIPHFKETTTTHIPRGWLTEEGSCQIQDRRTQQN
jgi:hypothetical protein